MTCLLATCAFFLDLGVGAALFHPTVSDGTWYQQAFPHEFETQNLALRTGIGYRFNDRWRTTLGYARLGPVKSTSLAVADGDYDPNAHRCLRNCTTPFFLHAVDTLQGAEWSVTRTFPFEQVRTFLKVGGAVMWHWVNTTAGDFTGRNLGVHFDGIIPMVVAGTGLCYHWICGEVSYYYGVGNNGSRDFPISTRVLVPMVSLQVPLW